MKGLTEEQIKERELDRFVRFFMRLKEENLLDIVGIINVDPKTKKVDVLKLKPTKEGK